jgi:integrase
MRRPSEENLEAFHEHLLKYGRVRGTADLYVHDIDKAYREGGPVARLGNSDLAPKTRRHILAACRAWAKWKGDAELLLELERMKLPSPARRTAKIPMSEKDWFRLLDEIDDAEYLDEPMRSVLGCMAARGFRCGDVLRLKRGEVRDALDTGTLAYEAKGGRRLEFGVLKTYRRYLEALVAYPKWKRVEDLISPRAHPHTRRRAASRQAERHLDVVAESAALEGVYPHRLRRTYATHYLRQLKGDPEALAKLQAHMQWSNIQTAFGYVDWQERETLDKVAEKMMRRRK